MNWEQIQGKWQKYKGRAKQRWGKLTDNDLTVIAGERDVLVGKLLENYGKSKEHVEEGDCRVREGLQYGRIAQVPGTPAEGCASGNK